MSKAEKTRDYIIQKAAPVFNIKGYAGTSMGDITEATGLTKGSIYGNFKNKDEVALAVFDYNLARVNNALGSAVAAKTNALEKLIAAADFYRSSYKKIVTEGGCPVLNTAVEADDNHPALRKKASDSIKGWKKLFESIISKGIENKEIRKGVNAGDTAIVFIALIEGGIMMSKTTGDTGMLHTSLEHMKSIILNDLKP